MVVPMVVVGVGDLSVLAPIGLADSYLGLIVVHAALGAPFVLTTVSATLQGFNHNLVRASQPWRLAARTFFRITLPRHRTGRDFRCAVRVRHFVR